MKHTFKSFGLVAMIIVTILAGCKKTEKEETFQILFGPNKTQIGDGSKEFRITENVTIKKGTYTMVGWIYVDEGATLTIEPGTVIKGTDINYDGTPAATGSSLIIMRGAKIMAEGTREQPIVFTSNQPIGQRQPADWGGVIICGRARNNKGEMDIEGGVTAPHGGNDDNDNSGVLRFVRIEFGGYPFAADTEINGLTMGSVGRGTTIEYVQVSYCGDDSFEWFGGSVNGRYLIAYHGWDDDFDTDNGFSGKLQFLLGVRDPRIADISNSNGFESDNDNPGSNDQPYTTAVFSNVTIIGPRVQDNSFTNTPGYITGYNWGNTANTAVFPIKPGIFQAAVQIRRNSRISVFNSVFAGYPVGLLLDKQRGDCHGAAERGDLIVKNVFMAGMGILGADDNRTVDGTWYGDFSATYFRRADLNNRETTIDELMLNQPRSKGYSGGVAPNWGPRAGSPLLAAGTASFTDPKLNDPFFDRTATYVGAFKSDSPADDWTRGWANFDPQNTNY